jgi:predicted HAD superfamily Cof-like phosphohydrolase
MVEEIQELMEADTIEDEADALADLLYFALGCYVEMSVDAGRIFKIVHDSNMKKYDCGVLKDDDTKIRKGKGWKSPQPEIRAEIEAMEVAFMADRDNWNDPGL